MTIRRLTAIALIAASVIACSTAATDTPGAGASTTASPAAASSLPIPGGIVGDWTTTITEADLRAGGVTGAGELGENAATITLHLGSDGTWSTSQVTDVPVKWPVFKGTLVALGSDSFRQVTTFPADFAGDSVDFTWSRQGAALVIHVQNPPDHILPIIMESHPWQPKP
jgi:hypothetical protein